DVTDRGDGLATYHGAVGERVEGPRGELRARGAAEVLAGTATQLVVRVGQRAGAVGDAGELVSGVVAELGVAAVRVVLADLAAELVVGVGPAVARRVGDAGQLAGAGVRVRGRVEPGRVAGAGRYALVVLAQL